MKRVAIATAAMFLASIVSTQAMTPAPAHALKSGSEVTQINAKKKMHHMSGMKGHKMMGHKMSGMSEHKTGMNGMGNNDKMPGMSGDHSKMKGMKGM